MTKYKFITVIIFSLLLSLAAFGQETTTATTTPTLEPKQEGAIRIGVVAIKTKIRQDENGMDTSAEVIRTRWYSFLDGPTIELIPLEARIPLQVNIEAEQKQCDYVLYSSVTQKLKGSFFGSFVKIAVPVLANSIPVGVGGVGGTVGQTIKNSVKEGAKDAAKNMAIEASSKIKAKDQVTLDFIFVKVTDKTPVITKSLKAKAKADGEDVFSTLIEQAAGQILEVAMKG